MTNHRQTSRAVVWTVLLVLLAWIGGSVVIAEEGVKEGAPSNPNEQLLYSCAQIFRNVTSEESSDMNQAPPGAGPSDASFRTGSSSCRCFDGTPGSQLESSNPLSDLDSVAGTLEGIGSLPWLGCTRATMPQILKAFRRLTPAAKLGKLWLWDNVMPLVPGVLFANISTQRLILETSGVVDFTTGALQSMGNQLRELELRSNEITRINVGVFEGLTNLRRLCLNSNKLTAVNSGAFNRLGALNYLALQQNKIKSIDDRSFEHLESLQTLDLSYNQLKVITRDMFSGLGSLEILSLEGNQISSFDTGAFSHLKNLKSLNLAGNNLSQFVVDQLPSLQKLYLSNNSFRSISDIDLSVHTALRVLHLDKNDISDLSGDAFRQSNSLIILSLTNNQIQNLDPTSFTGLSKLETLSLQQNVIEEIPREGVFAATPQLRRLFLSHNRLAAIGSGSFRGLQALRSLNLGHNQIDTIAPDVFEELFSLEKLYVNDNLLQFVGNDTFSGVVETLQALDLSNNPWQCDCPQKWFLEWFNEMSGTLMIKPDDTVCGVPDPGMTSGGAGRVENGGDAPNGGRKQATSQVRVQLQKAFKDLEGKCRDDVTKVPITQVTHTGITVLACALGTLSIMILVGVAMLFWQDHLSSGDKATATANGATEKAGDNQNAGKYLPFNGGATRSCLSSSSPGTPQDGVSGSGGGVSGGILGAANNRLNMAGGPVVDGSASGGMGTGGGITTSVTGGSSLVTSGGSGARPKKQVTIRMPPDMVKLLPSDNTPPGSVASNINQI